MGSLGYLMQAQKAISGIGSKKQNADGSVKGGESDGIVNDVRGSAMDIVGVAGLGAGVVSLVLVGGIFGPISGAFCCVMAPYAAYQKRHLGELGGFRGQTNELRGHVNELHEQNDELGKNVDELEGHVGELEKVEQALEDMAKKAQTDVERLVHVVQENGRLQKLIEENLRKKVLQDVMSIVVKSDRNHDYTLNRAEIEILIFRLQALPSVDFQTDNFRKLLKGKRNLTVTEVMSMLRNLMNATDDEEAIFKIKKPKVPTA
eukprot:CAMPEP_0116853612 /NCGR_PEP_ID=MMETSP0418-20121206/18028_1 /TAXON_ID=1158023 /ORGANISM="Astrosyne radiata, Strain 13vi08-1A" /LENGTH=260 /DNA_ID=CAMNT_0004486071 /DNA_START=47 /DNA_END=829 /DNA_ORIENTATION=+